MSLANFINALKIPIFCMPSGHALPIIRDYHKHGLFTPSKLSIWRTEHGAGLGAVGYSTSTRKASLLVATAGPGITNSITAVKQAYEESLPIIVLGVNNFSSVLDRKVGSMHEIPDSMVFFETISCHQERILKSENFVSTFLKAFEIALRENSPVYLEIPSDVLIQSEGLSWDESIIAEMKVEKYKCELSDEFISDLIAADSPIIIAGWGTVMADCVNQVEVLANLLNVPLVPTVKASSWYGGKQNVGAILDRTLTIGKVAAEADLIIALGTSLSYLNTSNNNLKFGGKIYRFASSEPFETSYRVNEVRCDARFATESILKVVEKNGINPKNNVVACELLDKRMSIFERDVTIGMSHLRSIQKSFMESTMFVFDLCLQAYIFQRVWNVEKKQRFLLSFGWGNLGSALPMALGILCATSERNVVCLCGDGGFNYAISELSMLEQINPSERKLTILLFNNQAFGTLSQIANDETLFKTPCPDYSKISSAYKMKYFMVDGDDVDAVLAKCAKVSDAHCFVELRIHEDPLIFNRLKYDD